MFTRFVRLFVMLAVLVAVATPVFAQDDNNSYIGEVRISTPPARVQLVIDGNVDNFDSAYSLEINGTRVLVTSEAVLSGELWIVFSNTQAANDRTLGIFLPAASAPTWSSQLVLRDLSTNRILHIVNIVDEPQGNPTACEYTVRVSGHNQIIEVEPGETVASQGIMCLDGHGDGSVDDEWDVLGVDEVSTTADVIAAQQEAARLQAQLEAVMQSICTADGVPSGQTIEVSNISFVCR